MSTELEKLLDEASGDPTTPIDPDALWAAGRRRRWGRRAGAAGGTAVLVLAVALAGVNLSQPGTPDIAPLDVAQPSEPDTEPGLVDDELTREELLEAERQRLEDLRAQAEADRQAAEEAAREAEQQRQEELAAQAEAEQQAVEEDAAPEASSQGSTPAPSPTPAPARVAAPCAEHQGREMDAFIAVAAPVGGQQVGSTVELVGCANVYEATVRYRLVGSGGSVDSFTTATCGTGCVGEFRETISVPAGSGPLTLEVFWDSPKDGSEQDKVTIPLARS
jgi:hypothetical protein